MKKEQIKGSLSLFLAAIIWGAAFVAQSVGMDYVGPFTFNCVRTLIGGIVLIPCIAFLNRGKVRKKTNFTEKKRLLLGGICCGVALATGSTLQQFGIMYTTVGKAGFITAFYIIIVPILGLFLGKKVRIIRLDQRCDRTCRTLFFMHYGRIFDWKRGYLCIFRCNCIFDSYFSDRLFYTI